MLSHYTKLTIWCHNYFLTFLIPRHVRLEYRAGAYVGLICCWVESWFESVLCVPYVYIEGVGKAESSCMSMILGSWLKMSIDKIPPLSLSLAHFGSLEIRFGWCPPPRRLLASFPPLPPLIWSSRVGNRDIKQRGWERWRRLLGKNTFLVCSLFISSDH